ncbi:MAG: hypothetical protein GY928_05250 [Colwellia sp.]|nr:hypothetical protein [Colwellia sp.]
MNKFNLEHSYFISGALNVIPPHLRGAVLSDSNFCKKNGVTADAEVTLGNMASFSRSILFKAIREMFSTSISTGVLDENGTEWTVSISLDDNSVICIERLGTKLKSNTFWPLMDDVKLRTLIFDKEAKRRNIAKIDIEQWFLVLSNNQLNYDEVKAITSDLELTPSYIEEQLSSELSDGNNKIKTLVPDDIRYYERLVGTYSNSSNIHEYTTYELTQHFGSRVNNGVSYLDLLLCSQEAVSVVIAKKIENKKDFISLANTAIKIKDPISLIGCFEIGVLNYLESNESLLQEIFDCLCEAEMLKSLTLLCSMTIFIDGELARSKTFKNKPPFYRRLASISQASLVTKVALEKGNEFLDIEKWAMEERGMLFYCQTFIDLREEPRWLPGYLSPEQLRDELLGRVHNVCHKAQNSDFCTRLLQDLTNSSLIKLNAFLPGPLEGNTEPSKLPDYMSKSLDDGMNNQASLVAFRSFINSAQFWKVDQKYVELALTLLKNAQHELRETSDKESIFQTINGLAKVAALVRSKKLAASVAILSRIYRDYLNVNTEPEHIMGLGLVAAAAFDEKDEWAEYIGQWMTELAYLPLEVRAISPLRNMLEQLCILEPYLYYTCGRPLEILNCLEKDLISHTSD